MINMDRLHVLTKPKISAAQRLPCVPWPHTDQVPSNLAVTGHHLVLSTCPLHSLPFSLFCFMGSVEVRLLVLHSRNNCTYNSVRLLDVVNISWPCWRKQWGHLAPDAVRKFWGMHIISMSSMPASPLPLPEAEFPFPLSSCGKII